MNQGKKGIESVLVLQGGGSLGAYECGVYKALTKHSIGFDIIAGTSIGAVNAAIIAGSRSDLPAKDLEDFWYTLAEQITPSFLPDQVRGVVSSMNASLWGNPKAFMPRWFVPSIDYFFPFLWPYFYDITPLKKTLQDFADFSKLRNPDSPRLIVTSTDIHDGKAVVFDSKMTEIDATHILASAGFPFYGIAWTKKEDKYLWDGTLMSNTPLREVIDASPRSNKKVYIVNLFPRKHKELPKNMFEAWHRARDIMYTDKTYHNVKMSRVISRYLTLLKEMHDIMMYFFDNIDVKEEMRQRILKVEPEYHKLAEERGAIIENIIRIERSETIHFLFEDADFSIATIKQLIRQGEEDAEKVLSEETK
jgi:NTE family protein